MNKDEIISKVRAAGVTGAGGAGFPAHVKLDATVEHVLGNGASCEPLLMSDPCLMEKDPDTILRGLQMVMDCTGAHQGSVCLKGKHQDAMEALKKKIGKGSYKKIGLFELGDFYPAGDEQVLVYEVTKRVVPEGGIPLQVGAVVSNVETLLNIKRAVDEGIPVTERYLTVAGEVLQPMIIKVPIGISVGDVIALAGGSTLDAYHVVMGGPMMGQVIHDMSAPVTKTTSGIIVLPTNHNIITGKIKNPEQVRKIAATICCQCTRCTDLCPRKLLGHRLEPHKIMRSLGWNTNLADETLQDALICSECGICEKYACPMMISPREVNAAIKRELLTNGVKRPVAKKKYRPSNFRDMRKIPTKRLMQRLGISGYDNHPELYETEIQVSAVAIPLKQHLGAPSVSLVREGDHVAKGDVIGEIPEKALGARVHASISGRVTSVGDVVVIKG
jgi:Na+-translocating ferredoxin:NAD+ oxidoreductase RnfC subunit